MNRHIFWTLAPLTLALALTGCGGGSSDSTPPAPTPPPVVTPPPVTPPPVVPPVSPPAAATYSIGGSVSGLASGNWVVLLNNGGNNLTVLQNGAFTFSNPLTSGATYAVTIGQQPVGKTCTISQGSDSVVANNVTNIQVSCINSAPPPVATQTVGGTITGLPSGKSVTLQDNGGDGLTLNGNGSSQNFTFATGLANGASYAVTVSTQPAGMKCSVTNGSGTMGSTAVSNVAVNCLNLGETVLYSFGSSTDDGQSPRGNLILDASGTLYGTTYGGGANNRGTVFKLTPAGVESVLCSFYGGNDGQGPTGDLVQDASGNLYGTTQSGGTYSYGTVFKITPAGAESVLHPFAGGSDGQFPSAGLIQDASGNLYGITQYGGANNLGTVFKITPAGAESVLYSFAGGGDGQGPTGDLVQDASGNLYGTTEGGGTSGYGTVFKITPAGVESVLYSFYGGNDGRLPVGGLVQDGSGNLYGTTQSGGTYSYGTVFKITPAGAMSVLYSFVGGINDGQGPNGDLVQDANGNFYGTTQYGGTNNKGTVFKITPSGTESVLHSFGTDTDGQGPQSGLTLDANGNLYGTTNSGGTNNMGTVFVIVP